MADFTRADSGRLTSAPYDVAIIGAGINGAAIARDAAQRGLRVALLERGDFGEGTSAWNSRLIHGGLRYLEHGEIPLVYESLHDRECLLRIAPHLVAPLPFVVPLYAHNHKPGWMFRIGMVLYDLLSLQKSVPRHRAMNRKAIAAELPGLDPVGLSGALRYYDGQVIYPERLVLETVLSAHAMGADVANYTAVLDVTTDADGVTGVSVRDADGREFHIAARCVVNAAGPWVDELASRNGIERQIGGTTGTHLLVDPFPGAPEACIYFESRADNRAILVIPWNGRYLIGTTDDRFDGDPGTVRGTDEEIAYLIGETNLLIPQAGLTVDDVLLTYTGVRPLPYRPGMAAGSIPRSHLIVEHETVPRLITIVGGKLTPHLSLGTQTVDKIAQLLGADLPKSRTARQQLPGAHVGNWLGRAQAGAKLKAGLPWAPEVCDRLLAVYGARVRQVRRRYEQDAAHRAVFGSGRGAVTAAEVVVAVHDEGARTLTDILHRRSMVGLEPALGLDVAEDVATFAAGLLGWDATRVRAEIDQLREYVTRLQGGVHRAPSPAPVA